MPRLDILLARNLGWSRAVARAAVDDGQVKKADGAPLTDARADVEAPLTVTIDDDTIELWDVAYVLQHKPTGCVTALQDPRHPTAYALLREAPAPRRAAAGRPARSRHVGPAALDHRRTVAAAADAPQARRAAHLSGRPGRAVQRAPPRASSSTTAIGPTSRRWRRWPRPTPTPRWRGHPRRRPSRPSRSWAAPTTRSGASSPPSAATSSRSAASATGSSRCQPTFPPANTA